MINSVTPEPAPLTDRDFAAVRRFLDRETGIHLNDTKKALVVSRLMSRLRTLRIGAFRDYLQLAFTDAGERQRLIDALTTNETRFFREPAQFDYLRDQLLPRWRAGQPRTVRVWSAGCSTGEEPYSIAMLLLDALPRSEGWSVEVLATDLSSRALDAARAGIWTEQRTAAIPNDLRRRYMMRGVRTQAGMICAAPELREVIHFAAVNLNDAATYPGGLFDAVFCRNVLIYFSAEARQRTIAQLLAAVRPGGNFFLGHAESISGVPEVRSVMPNVYQRIAP